MSHKNRKAPWMLAFPVAKSVREKAKLADRAAYRAEAEAFVRERVRRGLTCEVVNSVSELRFGQRYGWPVSNRLTEIHHTRGRLGSLLMDKRFWMAVSKAGHRYIHSHPAEARRRGWICEAGLWNTPEACVSEGKDVVGFCSEQF